MGNLRLSPGCFVVSDPRLAVSRVRLALSDALAAPGAIESTLGLTVSVRCWKVCADTVVQKTTEAAAMNTVARIG